MVEVPAAVQLAERLLREVDFLSIGTNDLIQYILAVDRSNRKVANLYEPLHPAVLAALYSTIQAGKRDGKRVGMCGEMAGDPIYALCAARHGFRRIQYGIAVCACGQKNHPFGHLRSRQIHRANRSRDGYRWRNQEVLVRANARAGHGRTDGDVSLSRAGWWA